jgi:hypothetical protein
MVVSIQSAKTVSQTSTWLATNGLATNGLATNGLAT